MSDMANHPVVLHGDLYAEHEHAPQTQFVLERQVAFLEALAVSGSVRAAARRARVSHQTCYRARRNSAAFGRAWDAALVVARGAAEAQLADYAMNGVPEDVWYHGEIVGKRTRFSDRLLLAHLARLDRMRADARIEVLAEDFGAMLTRLRRGEAIDAEPAGDAGADLPPGPCNMRSMSRAGEVLGSAPAGASPAAPARPCCVKPRWPQCRGCPHFVPVTDLADAMAASRPANAPSLPLLGSPGAVSACQAEAFEAGDEDWWRMGEDYRLYAQNACGEWTAEETDGVDVREAEEAAGAAGTTAGG